LSVPPTAQAILAARIDRLEAADKRRLQAAAVVGKDVPLVLLQAIAEETEDELRAGIARLQGAEFLYEARLFPEVEYTFKHALTHEVAYGSVLLERRKALHRRLGLAIEQMTSERLPEQYETLAYHFSRAEVPEKALEYLVLAGDKATKAFANRDAIRFYEQASRLIPEEHLAPRIDVLQKLARVHQVMAHYGESLPLYEQARELAAAHGDTAAIARLETHIGRVRYNMGDNDGAIAWFGRALSRSQDPAHHVQQSICYQSMGDVLLTSSGLPAAIEKYMMALHICEKSLNDVGVAVASSLLCNANARAGSVAEALGWGRRAVELSERIGDDRRLAWSYVMMAHYEAGQARPMGAVLDRARYLAERVGDARALLWVDCYTAAHAQMARDWERALERHEIAIQIGKESGGFHHEVSWSYARGAEALMHLGRTSDAIEFCRHSLALSLPAGNKLESRTPDIAA
jgi:tetratricopeptide (TPR) repeat protein